MKAKLAGALAPEEDLASQLTSVLSEATHEAEGEQDQAPATDAAEDPTSDAAPAGADLSKLWFLRPGAPEDAPPVPSKAPALSLDALPTRDLTEPPSEKVAAALFSLSARAIVDGGSSPAPAVPARPETPVVATPEPAAADGAKRKVPRLDATQIEMINKLRASSAAAVENITSEADVVDLRKPALPEAASSPAPAIVPAPAEPVAAEAPSVLEKDEETSEPPAARAEPAEADVGMLLSRPARSTPLFVGPNAQSRPIVSAPPLPLAPADDAEDAEAQPAAAAVDDTVTVVIEEPAVALAAHEPDLEDVLEPTPLVAEPAVSVEAAAAEDALPPPPVRETIHTINTVAAPVPPPPAPVGMPATMGGRPLEEMIAAVLEPVMQRLLEKNLGPMIEAMVRREVEKAVGKSQDT
ncbi:MAG: DUF2497 domain-containing protein [Hyphomicrobiales bacterium]|nr:MAG: DUF2497 domain-containing protein [Hyphomicrobiales bacterium]